MNPYTILSSGFGSHEATDLTARLTAWHDAMVAHERRLRAGTTSDACNDECAHAEAEPLWAEAVATFGARAQQLTFLRSRAQHTRRTVRLARPTRQRAEAAECAPRGPAAGADTATSLSASLPAGAPEVRP